MGYFGAYFGGGGGPSDDKVLSVLPIGRAPARWEPVVFTLDVPSHEQIFVFLKTGGNRFVILDGDGFAPMFLDRSSAAVDGDSQVITLLPNGGWWQEFEIRLVSGAEIGL